MFNANKYIERRRSLKELLKTGIVLFPGNREVPYNYPGNCYRFRQDSNFLYFFGLDIPNLMAIIDIDSGEEILFGDELKISDIIWTGSLPALPELAAKAGVKKYYSIEVFNNLLSETLNKKRVIHIVPVYQGETKIQLSSAFNCHPEEVNKMASESLITAIIKLRSIKDEQEINEIENMIDVAGIMHKTAMKMARPGITEREIEGVIEGICLSHGYNVPFSIICSIHGEILHNPYYNNTLKKGQLLFSGCRRRIAYALCKRYYAYHAGRRKFDARQREIYEIVLTANLEVVRIAGPGLSYRDIHLAAAKVITAGLKSIGLMKGNTDNAVDAGAHALFFPHGLGHMLGLDVHDMEGLGEKYIGYNKEYKRSNQFGLAYLRMARELEPGFVITDEPGIYFIPALINQWKGEKKFTEFINYDKLEEYKGFGGIRIEDDLLITQTGCRVLGKPIPKNIEKIESIYYE